MSIFCIFVLLCSLLNVSYSQFAVSQTGDVHLLNTDTLNITSRVLINGADPITLTNLIAPKVRALQKLTIYPINSRRYQKFNNENFTIQDVEMFTLNGTAHLVISSSNNDRSTAIWRWDSFYEKFVFLQFMDLSNGWVDDITFFSIGNFHFLTQCYAKNDGLGDNTLWRYNNATGLFTSQNLFTGYVQEWEYCLMNSTGFLVGVSPSNTYLYRWNGTSFVLHNTQPLPRALSVKCIHTSSGNTYLAFGIVSPYGVQLYSYTTATNTFTIFGSVLASAFPSRFAFVTNGEYNMLAVSNGMDGVPYIYNLNTTITTLPQPLSFIPGINNYPDIELFTIDSDIYMIGSDFSTPPVGNILYKFNSRVLLWDRISVFTLDDDPNLDQSVLQPSNCFRYGEFNNQGWLFGCLAVNSYLYQLIPL